MSYDARMASATIVSDSTARAVHATVRIQLVATRAACAELLKPRASASCRGTARNIVPPHTTARRTTPAHDADGHDSRNPRMPIAAPASASMSGPTTSVVSRLCSRCYAGNVAGSTARNSGSWATCTNQISPVIAQVAPRVPAGSMSTGFRPRRLDARRAVRSPARRFCAPGRCNGDRPRYKCTPTFAPCLPWRGRWCGARSGAHVAGRGAHPRRARRCACGTHAG